MSNSRPIECGVPQGSVLGPLLFLVFISDIPIADSKHISYSSLYADDLSILFSFSKSPKQAEKNINAYLECLVKWLFKWRLKMNATKCCYIIFSKNGNSETHFGKNGQIRLKLKLKNEFIPYNPKPLFLGIVFDEYLCFNTHFTNLKSKALKRLNLIKLISHKSWHLSSQTLINVYMSLVGSIFTYSFFSVANVSQTNLNLLQLIQDRAIRCIFKTEWNFPSFLLSKLSDILPVKERFIQIGCRRLIKSLHNNLNTNTLFQEYLNSISSIQRSKKRQTFLCAILPIIALANVCRFLVFILAVGLQ